MATSVNVLLAPVAITLFIINPPDPEGWIFILATWLLHVVYFITLSRAYASTDLSLVYPIARGLGLMLIPVLGLVVLNEEISPLVWIGVFGIFSGIFLITWWGRFKALLSDPAALLKDRGIVYALATGILISIYSVVDKSGVEHVTPFLYMYLLTSAGTIGMLPILSRGFTRADFIQEWAMHKRSAIAGGGLQFIAYGLVLTAFEVSRVSYVGPFREIGIVIGVVMGSVFLGEQFGRGRLVGGTVIVSGAVFIAIAP
ncbi:MAG: EamA family transporter [Chloroflexi bacterium]|nr:EamA family transporter [Chloroflexota bacterium]